MKKFWEYRASRPGLEWRTRILSPLRLPFRHPGRRARASSAWRGEGGIIAAIGTVRNVGSRGASSRGSRQRCRPIRGPPLIGVKGRAVMDAYTIETENAMSNKPSELGNTFWGRSLDEVDREVARLSTICSVRILDPGVIERILRNDSSVCGSKNPLAFDKLRNAMKMHYHLRDEAVGQIGEAKTQVLIADIVERLRARIGERLGGNPTAQ